MAQGQNWYKADLREVYFLLFEQFGLQELLNHEPFADWSEEEVRMVIEETYRLATEVLGPLNRMGDVEGCRLEGGQVKTPTGFQAAWKKLFEAGWRSLSVSEELGGQGAPSTLATVAEEFFSGSNPAFNSYPSLTHGAADLIGHFGTPEQKERFAKPMFQGRFGGTMCLSEPHAGSDVGAAKTMATPHEGGAYKIKGTKVWITAGDHDLAETVVHLVLARIEGADAGTKGLSLFIVPKHRVGADGEVGELNDVTTAGLEHKMGFNGSATCQLVFGDRDDCIGYLVGGVAHQGMRQMFQMMNAARIFVGIQGLGVAAGAYLNALDYAKERQQGSSIERWKDSTAPRVAIIEHPDVRRMLLEMKAKTEGIRALIVKITMHQDRATALAGKDAAAAAYHHGQVDLLTPIVKSYSSDQAYRVAETAIQVHGGAGYVRDFPVEQAARDCKVFSIYEGTNHIQALDLVARKLGLGGGKVAQAFFSDVEEFVAAHKEHEVLGSAVQQLAKASESVAGAALQLFGWLQGGKMKQVPLFANAFLDAMSEVVVGWLLLEGAAIADAKQAEASESDTVFYEGKKAAARHFAHSMLPTTIAKTKSIQAGDRSALELPIEGFARV